MVVEEKGKRGTTKNDQPPKHPSVQLKKNEQKGGGGGWWGGGCKYLNKRRKGKTIQGERSGTSAKAGGTVWKKGVVSLREGTLRRELPKTTTTGGKGGGVEEGLIPGQKVELHILFWWRKRTEARKK